MAADTGMDTCPSPEITDSRKRPLDGDSENGDIKRSHFSSVQDLVTALPLANGHGNITSHFGESSACTFVLLLIGFVVVGGAHGAWLTRAELTRRLRCCSRLP
ncbi:hypothetical protein RR46_13354 [Papilio xuthus]|uniref:Uncharacterized protein n=1 Tax=Papilio xuthus TaxID=66420 RepID=A0A194PGH6_PAPXU|nr:hypothetical protein RR46_13354 [Papilio xuthus]